MKYLKEKDVFRVGDYITTKITKDYFRVEKVVTVKMANFTSDKSELVDMLLLKKILNAKLEFKGVLCDCFNSSLCNKVDNKTKSKIDKIFISNPKNLEKVNSYVLSIDFLLQIAIVCDDAIEKEMNTILKSIEKQKLTDIEIHSIITIKNNEFSGFYGDVPVGSYILRLVFVNKNLEINADSSMLYTFLNLRKENV